jgi:hypothetical protein
MRQAVIFRSGNIPHYLSGCAANARFTYFWGEDTSSDTIYSHGCRVRAPRSCGQLVFRKYDLRVRSTTSHSWLQKPANDRIFCTPNHGDEATSQPARLLVYSRPFNVQRAAVGMGIYHSLAKVHWRISTSKTCGVLQFYAI